MLWFKEGRFTYIYLHGALWVPELSSLDSEHESCEIKAWLSLILYSWKAYISNAHMIIINEYILVSVSKQGQFDGVVGRLTWRLHMGLPEMITKLHLKCFLPSYRLLQDHEKPE